MIERRVDVRAEPVGVYSRRAGERGNRGVRSNELAGAQGDQFADRYAVAGHDERLASVEGAHDVAAAVAEFALGDFASHDGPIVAPVLRHLCGNAPGVGFAHHSRACAELPAVGSQRGHTAGGRPRAS